MNENEQFLPIKNYEDRYLISNQGNVWSILNKKFLKPQKTRDGYFTVDLCRDGTDKIVKVHRLVAEAFIPNPNNLPTVNHLDEDKTNNKVDNLEWCSVKDNNNYGSHNSSLARTKGFPTRCIETGIIYFSLAEAERQTGIKKESIWRVCHGISKTAGKYHWEYVK